MFKSAGLAKMFAGRRKFFRGLHVRHLWFKPIIPMLSLFLVFVETCLRVIVLFLLYLDIC